MISSKREWRGRIAFNRVFLPIIVSIVSVLLTVIFLEKLDFKNTHQEEEIFALNNLSTVRARLEGAINSNLLAITGLISEISLNPEISQEEFSKYASIILAQKTQIRNIAAARNMVITHMHPLRGNEKALGLDYRKNEKQKAAALKAKEIGGVFVAGPVDLVQGGRGFIARTPIFESQGKVYSDQGRFWGLVSAVIDTNQLYDAAGLTDSDLPIEIAIRGQDSLGPGGAVFYGRANLFDSQPVLLQVSLPNGSWQLAATPIGGWTEKAPNATTIRIIGIIIVFTIFGIMSYREWQRAEKQIVEDALRESEERYELAVQEASIWDWNLETDRLYFSPRFSKALGYSKEEFPDILKDNITSIVHPDDVKSYEEELHKHLEHPSYAFEHEHRFRLKSGGFRWYHARGKCFLNDEGKAVRSVGLLIDISDRKQAENQADIARMQLQESIETMSEGFALFDKDDCLVLCNNVYREMYSTHDDSIKPGNTFEEILRAGVSRGAFIIPPGSEEEWLQERITQHRKLGAAVEQKLTNGRWLLISEQRTKDGGTVGVRTDITELKEKENQLRESEERFRDFANSTGDWLWEMGPDLRFTYMSARVEEVTGVPVSYHLGKTREELTDDDLSQEHWQRHLKDIQQHRPFKDFRYVRHGHDGRRQIISTSGWPVFDIDGLFMGYRGIGSDITLKTKAERLLSDAIESISEGFVLYDHDDKLVICNRKYKEIYAASAEAIVPGASFEEIIRYGADRGQYAEAEGRVEEFVRERLTKHQNPKEVIEQHLGNGRWLRIEERKTVDGGIVGIRSDITEIKQAQEQAILQKQEAEKANRSKSEFLANMSHDLRTPLNAIIGFSDLMQTQVLGPMGSDQYLEYSSDINKSGHFLLNLINSILDLSKIEAGKFELTERDMEVQRHVQSSVKLLSRQAAEADIRILINISPELPKFNGDERIISQVLNNLLSNAVKFTGEGGTVSVSVTINQLGGLEICVSDTGIGMTRDEIARVMKPFEQVKNNSTQAKVGTGLGLPLCDNFVQMHGGVLVIESEPGKGTNITARFPPERTIYE